MSRVCVDGELDNNHAAVQCSYHVWRKHSLPGTPNLFNVRDDRREGTPARTDAPLLLIVIAYS